MKQEKQQTAVEWLEKQIKEYDPNCLYFMKEEIQQAKEIEKQQIMNAFEDGVFAGFLTKKVSMDPDEYFDKTYGK